MHRRDPRVHIACAITVFIVAGGVGRVAVARGEEPLSRRGAVVGPNDLSGKARDGSLDAASLFAEAERLYVEQPGEISNEELLEAISRWPSELTERQQSLLRQWVARNAEALARLRLASQRPDYLTPFKKDSPWDWYRGYDRGREKIVRLMRAAIFRVKFTAGEEGVTDEVEADLLMCRRLSVGLTQSSFLLEYLIGTGLLDHTAQTAFHILAKMPVDLPFIVRLQDCLGRPIPAGENPVPNFMQRERLRGLPILQRAFEGTDPESKLKHDEAVALAVQAGLTGEQMDALDLRYGRTAQDFDAAYTYCGRFLSMSPWQARTEGLDFWKDLDGLTRKNPLVRLGMFNAPAVAGLRARRAARQDALATTLASMRYMQEKGEFPASLQELVSAGYMPRLPADPYSDKPLVYRRTQAGFTLYSVAEDFDDDGGQHSDWGRGEKGGDYVFWPVQDPVGLS